MRSFLLLLSLLGPGDKERDAAVRKAVDEFKAAVQAAKTPGEKALAIVAFGNLELKDPAMVPALSRYLVAPGNDLHLVLPTAAADALSKFRGDKAAANALLGAVQAYRKNPYLTRRLLAALARVGHESVLPWLEEQALGRDPELAVLACESLDDLPPVLAVETLLRVGAELEKRKGLGDDQKKFFEKVGPGLLRSIRRISGEPYVSLVEFQIWWRKRGELFREKEKAKEWKVPQTAGLPASLLVELTFGNKGGGTTPNAGALAAPATLTGARPEWSDLVAANAGPCSLDFGKDPGPYAVEIQQPLEGLRHLKSFTISGWLNLKAVSEGAGGNRVVTWLGRDGVELVHRMDGSLQLGVNQPAADSAVRSAPARIPVCPDKPADAIFSNWRFFAVTYDSTLQAGHAKFYFGTRNAELALDLTRDCPRGPVGPRTAPGLWIGNVPGPRAKTCDTSFRGMIDDLRIHGSLVDGSGALSLPELLLLQNRETSP
jgi:hypothetical protein